MKQNLTLQKQQLLMYQISLKTMIQLASKSDADKLDKLDIDNLKTVPC